jgi:hypothetical protein
MKIAAALTKEFKLESDPDGEAIITIRQARNGEEIERADHFSRITRNVHDPMLDSAGFNGRVSLTFEQNDQRLRRKEAYLTMGKLTGIYTGDGSELFQYKVTRDGPSVREAMSETEFNRAWAYLPVEMADEITKFVREVNPTWDPNFDEKNILSASETEPETT